MNSVSIIASIFSGSTVEIAVKVVGLFLVIGAAWWLSNRIGSWKAEEARRQTEAQKQKDQADLPSDVKDVAQGADEAASEIDQIRKQQQ